MMPSHDPDIVPSLFYEQGDRLGELYVKTLLISALNLDPS